MVFGRLPQMNENVHRARESKPGPTHSRVDEVPLGTTRRGGGGKRGLIQRWLWHLIEVNTFVREDTNNRVKIYRNLDQGAWLQCGLVAVG